MKTTLSLLLTASILHSAELKNPQMSDGTTQPDGWTQTWIGSGKIETLRDTATHHSAPASLLLKTIDGPAKGQTAQIIAAKPGQTLNVTGYLRADGGATALLGVMAYDENWTGIGFTAIGNALTGQDWVKTTGTATLPEKTARVGITLLIEGTGRAWLDDVSLDGTDPGINATPKSGEALPAPPKPAAPRKATSATDPAEGFWPDYPAAWKQTFQSQLARTKKSGIPILFLGDSLTQAWPDQEAWKPFAEKGAVSYGIGGDGTPQILYRLQNGLIDDLHPKTIVLQIGVNNVWPGFDAQDTVKGIQAILNLLREKSPKAKILLIGNTHFHDLGNGDTRNRVRTINTALAKLHDAKHITFIDFSEKLLLENGELNMDYYNPDKLHLLPKSYQTWAEAIRNHL